MGTSKTQKVNLASCLRCLYNLTMKLLEGLLGLYATNDSTSTLSTEAMSMNFKTRRAVTTFAAVLIETPRMDTIEKANDLAHAFHILAEETSNPFTKTHAIFYEAVLSVSSAVMSLGQQMARRFAGRSQ